jgi:hypothetical protein
MMQAERTLQAEIMARLNTRAWPLIALPVPNGIWLPAHDEAERRLVGRLIARMKADGLLTVGAPDLVLCWRDGSALVELKRPRSRDLLGRIAPAGRPCPAQSEIAERAARLGINHAFVTSWDELRQRLAEWGIAR